MNGFGDVFRPLVLAHLSIHFNLTLSEALTIQRVLGLACLGSTSMPPRLAMQIWDRSVESP